MKIRIVNLRRYELNGNEILFKVDRSNKILGNKFIMGDESERDEVCDKYEEWFKSQCYNQHSIIHAELSKIIELNKSNDIALGCWCYPKRCHAETIKNFLNSI